MACVREEGGASRAPQRTPRAARLPHPGFVCMRRRVIPSLRTTYSVPPARTAWNIRGVTSCLKRENKRLHVGSCTRNDCEITISINMGETYHKGVKLHDRGVALATKTSLRPLVTATAACVNSPPHSKAVPASGRKVAMGAAMPRTASAGVAVGS